MPIPTSDLQKQVKAPSVAEGKAVNFSDQAAAQMQALNEDIVKSGNLLAKGLQIAATQYVNVKRRASDDAAKQAFNDYEVAKDDLNTQLQSLEGQDAVDFYYGDYTKKINEAHQKLTAVLDSLPDKDIAQQYRDKVNDINQKNRGFSYLSAKRQENAVRDADHKAFLQNVSMEHVNDMVTAPEGVNRYEYAAANAYKDIDDANAEYLASRGLNTEAIRKAANQEVMTKFAGEMLRNVANSADWDGSRTGQVYQNEILPAVKAMQKYVDQGTYQQLLQYYAGEAIRTDASLRPQDFINPKTGEVRKDFVNKNYYGLTPWQKTQILDSVRTSLNGSHNSSLSGAETKERNDILDREVRHLADDMGDLGLETNADYRALQFQEGLSKDDVIDLKAQAMKKFDLAKALSLLNRMDKFRSTPITLTTGKEVLQDDDRVRKMYNDLYRFTEIYIREYKGQLKNTPGVWGAIKDNIFGTNPSVRNAAISDLIESQALQYRGSNQGAGKILDSLLFMDYAMGLDPSVNWDAPADSREGFYNPAVLGKVKEYAVAGLGESGGGFEVYRNDGIANAKSIIGGQKGNKQQSDYLQMMNRINANLSYTKLGELAGGVTVTGPDVASWQNIRALAIQKARYIQKEKVKQELMKQTEKFYRNVAEKDLQAQEEEQKQIKEFNGGYK